MRPRFSVVVAVHDRADVVGRATASVLAQTFADVEVVVVDAGSSDDSVAAVRAVADRRVRVLRSERPDLDAARQVGIRHSRGRHVALLDPEDEVAPGWLARIGRLIDSTGAALVCCGGEQRHADGSSTVVRPSPVSGEAGPDATLVCFRGGAFVVRRDLLDDLSPTPSALAAVLPGRLEQAGLAWVSTPERLVRWNDGTDRVHPAERATSDPATSDPATSDPASDLDAVGDGPVVTRRRSTVRLRSEVELRSSLQSIDALARSPIPDADLLARAATLGGIAATRLGERGEARRLFRLARRVRPDVAKHWVRWALSVVPPVAVRVWDVPEPEAADRAGEPEHDATVDGADGHMPHDSTSVLAATTQ